jgi:hypothetical protein
MARMLDLLATVPTNDDLVNRAQSWERLFSSILSFLLFPCLYLLSNKLHLMFLVLLLPCIAELHQLLATSKQRE